jgi:short-subunit dehydrogenase
MSIIHLSNVVAITGASGGVGRATAREFARKGYKIGLLARGKEGLEGARKDVEALGGKALTLETDVSEYEQVASAVERIENELGPISIWINNATLGVFSPVKEMQPEEYKKVTEVAYLGQVYGTIAAYERMRRRNSGSIVMISSPMAQRGVPLQSAQSGAKHAISGFFDAFRAELLHDMSNINLNMVHLPALNSTHFNWTKSRLANKLRPMGKVYQPEVAARAIYYAAHHDQRDVHVGSSTLKSVLGNSLFPGLMDGLLAKHGYTDQQTEEAEDPHRPDNFREPVHEDRGAHGDFDDNAADQSLELKAAMNRGTTTLLAVSAGVLTAGLIYWMKNND